MKDFFKTALRWATLVLTVIEAADKCASILDSNEDEDVPDDIQE